MNINEVINDYDLNYIGNIMLFNGEDNCLYTARALLDGKSSEVVDGCFDIPQEYQSAEVIECMTLTPEEYTDRFLKELSLTTISLGWFSNKLILCILIDI